MAAGQQGLLDFYYPQLVNLDKTITTTEFDINKFNKTFESQKETVNTDSLELQELNKQEKPKKLYNYSLMELLIGIKDTWFYLFDDLLQKKFYTETFTKDNRPFFIGLTIVLFVIIIYLYNIIFDNFDY
jgi:hypothetical protein